MDVLVVGGGPVGLLLAGELRLGGAEVIVLERLTEPMTQSRASTVHARTMELLDDRGLLMALGPLTGGAIGHFGGLPLDFGHLDSGYPGLWKVPQQRTELVLANRASELGADLRRGHEVVALAQRPGGVEVEAAGPDGPVRLRASYLVGCDGQRSTVRRLAGIGSTGTDATRTLLRADVAGIDIPDRRFERLDRGLAIAARGPDGVTRVMVHEFGALAAVAEPGEPGPTELAAAWARVTGEDISGGTPLWINRFGNDCRQAVQYRKGRILVAGDAAHRQMPVGGQAINLGLQDAVNLGWKLAAQVRARAPGDLLDTYHEERYAVGARVLGNIATQAHILLGGVELDFLRASLGALLGLDPVRDHLAGAISGLDVRYRVGPGAHPLLGTRLPKHHILTAPPGAGGTTLRFHDGRGVLLLLGGAGARTAGYRAATAPWADRVRTVPATASAGGPLAEDHAVLVRPDGYVVWTDPGGMDLPVALRRWFGAPDGT